ncbi:MAG: hypothetical protein IJ514_06665 [Clostridia bacterium]|nr:hypothetical protein [Clostridia bacterium]
MTSAKKKFRIAATLVAMVLVLMMMCMGIYAANIINVTNSGTLALGSSGDVLADVTVVKVRDNTETTIATKSYDRSYEEGVATAEDTIGLGLVEFTKVTDYVDYEITITNKFDTDTKVAVNMTTMTAPDPIKLELITADNLVAGTAHAIEKGQSYVMTVRISLDTTKITAAQEENGFTAQEFSFVLKIEKGSTTAA